LILLGVPPLGGYNYITPRRAGLSATAGLSCWNFGKHQRNNLFAFLLGNERVCHGPGNLSSLDPQKNHFYSGTGNLRLLRKRVRGDQKVLGLT